MAAPSAEKMAVARAVTRAVGTAVMLDFWSAVLKVAKKVA
jgi:hypothetical protein